MKEEKQGLELERKEEHLGEEDINKLL